MTRGDSKSDIKPRFPRIGASLPPLFLVGGVLLFSRELRLVSLISDPSEAMVTLTAMAIALACASLIAILFRARRAGAPIPWLVPLALSAGPTAAAALLPGAPQALPAMGLWASAWLVAALGWVAAVEVYSNRTSDGGRTAATICGVLVVIAIGLSSTSALLILPLCLLAVAVPVVHLGKASDVATESALVCVAPFLGAAIWLGYCAMLSAGSVLPDAMPWIAVAAGSVAAGALVAVWRVRPRALLGSLPAMAFLLGWALIAGVRVAPPPDIPPSEPAIPDDDGSGLRVPFVPRNPSQMY